MIILFHKTRDIHFSGIGKVTRFLRSGPSKDHFNKHYKIAIYCRGRVTTFDCNQSYDAIIYNTVSMTLASM